MAELFPSEIDQYVKKGSWRERPIDTTLRTKVDGGPNKARSRFTEVLKACSGTLQMTVDQFEIFEEWYKTTLGNGVKSFIFKHPLKNVDKIYGFVAEYETSDWAHNAVEVSFNWEERLE